MFFKNSKGRNVIRVTDTTDHGGEVITGATQWTVDGKPIARVGDLVRCPQCLNQTYPIVEGDEMISIEGRRVAFDGHLTACGARLISSLGSHITTHSDGFNGGIAGASGIAGSSLSSRNNAAQTDEDLSHHRKFKLLNHDGQPLSGIPYKISSTDSDKIIEGRTDSAGMTEDFQTASSEHVVFSIVAAGKDYEGARARTFLSHHQHITEVRVKIYWLHENLWNENWIQRYRAMIPVLAQAAQATQAQYYGAWMPRKYTCEDFALTLLIQFAYMHKLPLVLKTGAATMSNIDFNYQSQYKPSEANKNGFQQDILTIYGAPDTLKNCTQLPDKEAVDVGDLLLRMSNYGHVQVVVSKSDETIIINQGNIPTNVENTINATYGAIISRTDGVRYGNNSPDSRYYLGTQVEVATFRRTESGWVYQKGDAVPDGGQVWNGVEAFEWNFMEFNHL